MEDYSDKLNPYIPPAQLRAEALAAAGAAPAADDREMWLSIRGVRPTDGEPPVREVRTIDWWFNPCVDGNYPVYSLDELWGLLEWLPKPAPGREYYLLFTNALSGGDLPEHPRLKLLGFDLSDETWTSSIFNCSTWQGELEAIAGRAGAHGLLSLEDAKLAQTLLPLAWPGDPHGIVTVWALFEVVPDVEVVDG